MRTEDVRRLAVECDLDPHDLCEDPRIALRNLERFAALVAAAERELNVRRTTVRRWR